MGMNKIQKLTLKILGGVIIALLIYAIFKAITQ